MFKKHFRPVVPREEYICRSIESAWPSGEWVEDSPDGEDEGGAGTESVKGGQPEVRAARESPPTDPMAPGRSPSLTIIGGTKYDEDALASHIRSLPPSTTVITGVGRGAEAFTAQLETNCFVVEKRDDLYGKKATTMNVEQVLSLDPTSPLLLVGTGERVKKAKEWLKRANWGREVHELA